MIEFLQGILAVLGIEDDPTFTRNKIVNAQEQISTLLQAAQYLDDEYITRKILEILGDGDMADEVLKRKDAEDMERVNIIPLNDEGENGEGGQPAAQNNPGEGENG